MSDIANLIRQDNQYLATSITDDDTRRIWRAIVLSPTLEVCEALLRGQEVPPSALDPLWRKRFGL